MFRKYIHVLLLVLLQDSCISVLPPEAQKLPALCCQACLALFFVPVAAERSLGARSVLSSALMVLFPRKKMLCHNLL